jgi:hypothetical protein
LGPFVVKRSAGIHGPLQQDRNIRTTIFVFCVISWLTISSHAFDRSPRQPALPAGDNCECRLFDDRDADDNLTEGRTKVTPFSREVMARFAPMRAAADRL